MVPGSERGHERRIAPTDDDDVPDFGSGPSTERLSAEVLGAIVTGLLAGSAGYGSVHEKTT